MTPQEYEQKKRECWERYKRDNWESLANVQEAFNSAFDRAYALGKQTEAIIQEEIEKAAEEYQLNSNVMMSNFDPKDIVDAFINGVNFALGKQEKDAEKPKMVCLRDKSKVCNRCHECDIETDEWYSMSR